VPLAAVAVAVEVVSSVVVAVVVLVPVPVGQAYWVHSPHQRSQSLKCKSSSV
jgi:hypothetical protein